MPVQVSELSPIKKQLSVTVPVVLVKKELDRCYQKINQSAKLKGFRPGKIPRNVLEQYYRQDAESDAIRNLLNESYPEAVRESGLIPLASPEVSVTAFGPDQDFTYQATIELRPEFEVKGYEGLALNRLGTHVTDEDLNKSLENLQDRVAQLVPVEAARKAKSNDIVVMDYKGFIGGQVVNELSSKDSMVELGKGYLFPDIEAGLQEMSKGESKKIKVKYPDDWANKTYAGQEVEFEIEMKDLKEKKLPELNDEFAKDLGAYESLQELKDKVRAELQKDKEQASRNNIRYQVIDALSKVNEFLVPEAMVDSELNHMYRMVLDNLKNQGMTPEQAGLNKDEFFTKNRDEAVFRVRGALIFDEVSKKEKIDVVPEEVYAKIDEMAKAAGQAPDAWRRYYEKNNLLPGVAGVILEEKTLDFVLSKSTIKDT